MNLQRNINNDIAEVRRLISAGIEAWIQAGQIVAQAVDADPLWIDKACEADKSLSHEILHRFDQIGRKQIVPSLLLNDSPGFKRLRKLPYPIQAKYASQPVELLTADGSTLLVDVQNLTPRQARQVFASDRVRSLAEQRAFMEDAKAIEIPSSAGEPYRIVGKTVVVTNPCKFSLQELAQIVAKLSA